METTTIFDPGEVPFDSCHAATLTLTSPDSLLTAWFGGSAEGNDDVAIWASRRCGSQWKKPLRVAKVSEEPHWNPVLFSAPDGTVHLFFKVGRKIPDWQTWIMSSTDGGRHWTDPKALVPGDAGGRGPVKNKPIVLADGCWLAPLSIRADPDEQTRRVNAYTDRTCDGGRTWQLSSPVGIDHESFPGAGLIQPALWESTSGKVHMLMRSSCGRICRADSNDGGQTWSQVTRTSLPNNNSGIDLDRMSDGTLALVYNPVGEDWGSRTPLRLSLSYDNGVTWPDSIDLVTGEGEFSYPSIIARNGVLYVVYTWKRKAIAFWQGSPEHVREHE